MRTSINVGDYAELKVGGINRISYKLSSTAFYLEGKQGFYYKEDFKQVYIRGEEYEFSDDDENYYKKIFFTYDTSLNRPFMVFSGTEEGYGDMRYTQVYSYCRPIKKEMSIEEKLNTYKEAITLLKELHAQEKSMLEGL